VTPGRLDSYRDKRDFGATPEPADAGEEVGGRFVVQEHDATRLHWDLRLERDGVLVSWAVPNGIPDDPERNRLAVRTEDHPLSYLDFEGEIPKGSYGAGTMKVWDRGTYECEKFRDDEVIAVFYGERVRGRYALFQTRGKDWMIHRMDPPAHPDREPLPEHVAPMLAKPGSLPAREDGWGFEIKWDGVRAILYSEPGKLRMESRNGKDITPRYPEIRALGRQLGSRSAVLDGEVVAFDETGRPSFERLQGRMHLGSDSAVRRAAAAHPVTYVVFDLLHLDGRSLLALPYAERRARLSALELEGVAWQTPAHREGDGSALLAATAEQGLEGVIAKRLSSAYEPGRRSPAWIKVKNVNRQELVVGGWMPGEGRRARRIGALLVGLPDPDEPGSLRYAGRVGTGWDDAELTRLEGLLAPLERETRPFTHGRLPRGARWVSPELVAEIDFTEWTKAGLLRHPSYKGLRDDKPAAAAVREKPGGAAEIEVEGRQVKLSNRDKVLWPHTGFTKGDMVDYYMAVAPALLPHLRGRPLTMKRYPDGVEGQFFYEKQCPSHRPDWVVTAPIRSRSEGRMIDFCLVEDLPTLVWAANLADIELHTSLALAGDIEQPRMMVFDLDPGEGTGVLECARVAMRIHDLFAELGLETLVKTSGSKGLQAYMPLNTNVTYAQTKPFARTVAELLEKTYPGEVVSRMTKRLRRDRVLVDWSQNDEHKTTVNVYSLRARARPTVSTPLHWDEVGAALESQRPEDLVFEAPDVLKRVERDGDLFAPALSCVQTLPAFGG